MIQHTSSNKAAGIFNPITGRKMVKTWMADELFPQLGQYYEALETRLNHQLIHHKPIYRPFTSVDEQNDWQGKLSEEGYARYIQHLHNSTLGIAGLKDPFGGVLIKYSGYVDVPQLVIQVRDFLIAKKKFICESFESNLIIPKKGKVEYKGTVADKVIFCEGTGSVKNHFWSYLPFKPVKGEILEIKANFPEDYIVNRHVFLVPKKGTFIVGSTYNHEELDDKPSEQGIRNIQDRLERIIEIDYSIINSWAGVRPATYDRHPFIGLHHRFPEIGIFNGFGTKGVSLVPFFASQFVNFLKGNQPLTPEVDIKRVSHN
ncbi:unnamed protein product [Chrysoparadoxa australica]